MALSCTFAPTGQSAYISTPDTMVNSSSAQASMELTFRTLSYTPGSPEGVFKMFPTCFGFSELGTSNGVAWQLGDNTGRSTHPSRFPLSGRARGATSSPPRFGSGRTRQMVASA
jgi:hypothetical protein